MGLHLDEHPVAEAPEDFEGVAEQSFAEAASEAVAIPSESAAAAVEAEVTASASGFAATASSYS